MKKLFVSALAMLAVALGFTACSSDDEFVNETSAQGQKVTVIASTEAPAAQRTALGAKGEDGTYPVLWSVGDKIKIGDKEFTLVGEGGSSTDEFTGDALAAAEDITAYYPSDYNGETWPTEQTYVAGNMPIGVPMKATGITVNESGAISPISFKNVGGILRLNLKGVAEVISITVSADGLDPITLNCDVWLDPVNATPFHIAVPAGEYNDLQIKITEYWKESLVKKATSAITVERSKITDINLTCQDVKKDETTAHAYVELLGCKWATENVGAVEGVTEVATDPTYGYYYTQADAKTAAESWGNGWTLPTKQQWEYLIEDCSFEWKVNYPFGDKTTNGYIVSDFYNPFKYIFLPAVTEEGKSYITYYWTSDKSDTKPYCFWFEPEYEVFERDNYFGVLTNVLADGKFVRPVLGSVEN